MPSGDKVAAGGNPIFYHFSGRWLYDPQKKKKKNGKECKVFMVRVSALYDKGNYSEFLQGS